MIELGHALNLSVTAAGVETDEQLGKLQLAGCDTAQWFRFSRPVEPEVIDRMLGGRPDREGRPPKPKSKRRRSSRRRRSARRR